MEKKTKDIDDEVALLKDLRNIILEFIGQIRQADFAREADVDVRRLYEKAARIENRITNISYDGNISPVNRLLDVTDRLKKTPEVRIIRINPFRAFSSGRDTIENVLGTFQQWQEAHSHLVRKMIYDALDFLWFEEDMVNPSEEIKKALGYDQMDLYVPIKIRE